MVIGITGFSGTGKTYFAKKLRRMISSAIIIQQDNYYKGCPNDRARDYNFDTLEAIDVEKLYSDILKLKNMKKVKVPKYDFETHKRIGYYLVKPREIILLEGHLIFLDERIRKLTDLLIFLDINVDLALVRRIKRDLKDRGRDVMEVINRYERFVARLHRDLELLKKESDIVIPYFRNNEKAIVVISAFIEKYRKEI